VTFAYDHAGIRTGKTVNRNGQITTHTFYTQNGTIVGETKGGYPHAKQTFIVTGNYRVKATIKTKTESTSPRARDGRNTKKIPAHLHASSRMKYEAIYTYSSKHSVRKCAGRWGYGNRDITSGAHEMKNAWKSARQRANSW